MTGIRSIARRLPETGDSEGYEGIFTVTASDAVMIVTSSVIAVVVASAAFLIAMLAVNAKKKDSE